MRCGPAGVLAGTDAALLVGQLRPRTIALPQDAVIAASALAQLHLAMSAGKELLRTVPIFLPQRSSSPLIQSLLARA